MPLKRNSLFITHHKKSNEGDFDGNDPVSNHLQPRIDKAFAIINGHEFVIVERLGLYRNDTNNKNRDEQLNNIDTRRCNKKQNIINRWGYLQRCCLNCWLKTP